MKTLKIRHKITLWYALFLLVLLVIFSLFLYFAVAQLLYHSAENLVKADARQVLSILRVEGRVIRLDRPYEIITTNTYFVVFDSSGNANLGSETLPELVDIPIEVNQVRYVDIDNTKRIVYDEALKFGNETIGWIRVSRSLEDVVTTLRNLKLVLFVSIPLYIFFASLGGLFLSNRALRPIDDITKTAGKISKGDLRQRLSIPATEDEIGRLVKTFNEMLDKLESFIRKERQFTSDASHELRTPLAIISAEAEQSLAEKLEAKDYKKILEKILSQTKKMSYIISQLLMIHRSEEGKYQLDFEVLDLGLLAEDIINEYRRVAAKKGIKIDLEGGKVIKIRADQTLITRMLINLLDNAISFTESNGKISVSISRKKDFVSVAVKDNGIGIPEEEIPHIFDRFYQADKARNKKGSGLGLSIVKWIVDIHKGQIEVESKTNKGSKFTVKLPAWN